MLITFARKYYLAENFQKSPNLVTLNGTLERQGKA